MKKLIFISTGRCGTKRIAQILAEKLPGDRYAVVHQMKLSRLANVIGNIMYYWGDSESIKKMLYTFIISRYGRGRNFISTDPLTAMIVPGGYADLPEVCLVQILRDDRTFAQSMFSLSRSRVNSLIAHNFVPFWQPGIWPLENLLNNKVQQKYERIHALKNRFFKTRYSHGPNYHCVHMSEIFSSDFLQDLTNQWFHERITISTADLEQKANESTESVF